MTLSTAQRIKAGRIEAGLTQKQLAEKAGVQQGDISRYERGVQAPQGVTLDRIMEAIGSSHILDAVDGVLGIQGRAAGKLVMVDPMEKPIPVEWIVEGFVARGYTTMIAGEPGAGKSMLTQTIGVGLVEGREHAAGFKLHARYAARPCHEHETCHDGTPGADDGLAADYPHNDTRVLTIDAENGPNLIQDRVQSIGLERSAASRYIASASDGFDVYKDRAVLEGILADYRAEGRPVDLVILDSFTSVWFGNENVVEAVQGVLKSLNEIASRQACGILVIHHTDKDGENYRGSSAIAGTISGGVFTFARTDEKEGDVPEARDITCKKLRIAPEPHRMRVYVDPAGAGIVDERPDALAYADALDAKRDAADDEEGE